MLKTQWGDWKYEPESMTIYLDHPEMSKGEEYYVPLEEATTAAQVLDWIAQISKKRWATADVVANLIWALDDLLNLQGSLCPGGAPKTLSDVRGHLKRKGYDVPAS
jgi:hypothetical protein